MDDEDTFEFSEEDEIVFQSDDEIVPRRPQGNSKDEDEED
jgi:hypothetical protein